MLNFVKSTRGNVAMIFALCLLPLLVLMGGAVDLSRQRGGEVGAQNAIDAALLAVAHKAMTMSDEELTKEGQAFFETQLMGSNLQITSFTITKTGEVLNAEVIGKVETTFLAIMGLDALTVRRQASVQFGVKGVEIALVLDTTGSMEGKVSGTNKTKISVLRDAAVRMMNQLEAADAGRGKLPVSIVPFATYVNVGPQNANEDWMDTDAESPIHGDNIGDELNRFDLMEHLGFEWQGCVQVRPHPHDVEDTKPTSLNPETLFVPLFHPDEPDDRSKYPNSYVSDGYSLGNSVLDLINPTKYGVPYDILSSLYDASPVENLGLDSQLDKTLESVLRILELRGLAAPGNDPGDEEYGRDDCLGSWDKDNGYGNNTCPSRNTASWNKVRILRNYRFFSDVDTPIGPNFNCDTNPITPLTSNYETLRKEIRALKAAGSTNITEGITWGWRTLSNSAPFKEGASYSADVSKVLVLLSDGNNMVKERDGNVGGSDFSAYGYLINERLEGTDDHSDQGDILDAMDELTLEACSNIKAKGIRVITIRLDLTDDRSEKILSQCASSPRDYMNASNSQELANAFQKITEEVTQLYLSR